MQKCLDLLYFNFYMSLNFWLLSEVIELNVVKYERQLIYKEVRYLVRHHMNFHCMIMISMILSDKSI